MKFRINFKLTNRIFTTIVLIFIVIMPVIQLYPMNLSNDDISRNLKTQSNDSGVDSILWKLGIGLPGTGPTMQPKLVNFTKGGEPLIVVGTDEGLATITLDGFINMSYRTFGPVIDFDIIEDISGDNIDDIVLITYHKEHPNLIAISSNNASEIWKFKPIIEGISTETYEKQDFITYTWDLKIINDITGDSISEIVIGSWYRLIIVNGKSGNKIWMNDKDFSNDVWKLEALEDINNNGFETIIAGSEEGKLIAFDSKTGRKLWTFKVRETTIPVSYGGISSVEVPNSIDDIKVINDVNNDEIDDILIAADDGYLRVISGKSGYELGNALCYNVSKITQDAIYDIPRSSPYSSIERIFRKSGVKVYEVPDIDNDGKVEYISIACDLDYAYKTQKIIEGRILHINAESEFELINISISRNWTYSYEDVSPYFSSYPEIIKLDSDIQIYFYLYDIDNGYSSAKAQINRYDINDLFSQYPEVVYKDPDQYDLREYEYGAKNEIGHYLLNVGDLNDDGFDDLFAISANGRYLCIDNKNDDVFWVRTNEDLELEVTEINDLNDNGFEDFLIKQIRNFEPSWISSIYDENLEKPEVISGLFTIDGKTGNIIWTYNIPSSQYYGGLRDLMKVGDVTNDGIEDYAAWIIPSTIPPEISEIIKGLSGEESIELDRLEVDNENIYRALLSKYIKLLAIDGSNGTIFWNASIFDFPYRFYRQYDYKGTYENPTEGSSTGSNFYNRINGKIHSTWGDPSQIQWNNTWDTSTLLHPNNIQIINGSSSDNIFALGGDQNTNLTITSYNSSESSKSLKNGTTLDRSSIGTVESGDNLYWILNSISSEGEHKINMELSFNLSQPIESELQHIAIEYDGYVLNDVIEQIDIFIYNFSSEGYWKKISTSIINDTKPTKLVSYLYDINSLTSGPNKFVKVKLEARNSSAFTLYIDKLVVNYTYTYGNYTIEAVKDGNSWKTILDLVIPSSFSDDELLGVIEYPLSQIERFSALKLQNKLSVNTTSFNWYNFTYEIYDNLNSKWVLCNWDNSTRTWNDNIYPDLKGGYGGFRNDYKDFNFDNNSNRYDYMWLITRGTNDVDPYVEFDYENKTTLSNFIDSNKNIRIRLNITNGKVPFDLTIDSFGIGAFYWGLFSNQYDRYYIWDYDYSDYSGTKFTDYNLLNLKIQDFDVVNGTNDKYLDLITVCGIEGIDNWGEEREEEYSTRIRLFDIKNKEVSTKWSLNMTQIPYQNVRILPINNSLNNWILSGIFQFGNGYNCSHKFISDPHWESQITHFENYSDSKVEIDYLWEETPIFPEGAFNSSTNPPYEFPGKTTVSKDGKIGIILGDYSELFVESWGIILSNFRIIDIDSYSTISKISAVNLNLFSDYGRIEGGSIDFNSVGVGYNLLISYEDFNGDDFLDHVGIYFMESFNGYYSGTEIKIYSGNSGDSSPIILFSQSFDEIYFDDYSNKRTMPITSIDDINSDGMPEVIIGIQTRYDRCKGAYIKFYDVYNSNEYELKELSSYKLVMDSISCLYSWGTISYEFIQNVEKISDINADGFSEVCVYYNRRIQTTNVWGSKIYEKMPTTEILDISSGNTLYRFNININSIHPIVDLNGDGKKELLIVSEEALYCINSLFSLQILKPKNEQSMRSHNFNIEWDTNSSYDYFEVFINKISQGPTMDKKLRVSIGPGRKEISVVMFDRSGLILAVSTINVLIPRNQLHLILTFIIPAVAVGLYLLYRRFNKKKEMVILIDKKIKERGEMND